MRGTILKRFFRGNVVLNLLSTKAFFRLLPIFWRRQFWTESVCMFLVAIYYHKNHYEATSFSKLETIEMRYGLYAAL